MDESNLFIEIGTTVVCMYKIYVCIILSMWKYTIKQIFASSGKYLYDLDLEDVTGCYVCLATTLACEWLKRKHRSQTFPDRKYSRTWVTYHIICTPRVCHQCQMSLKCRQLLTPDVQHHAVRHANRSHPAQAWFDSIASCHGQQHIQKKRTTEIQKLSLLYNSFYQIHSRNT